MVKEKSCDPYADNLPGWPISGLFQVLSLFGKQNKNLRAVIHHGGKVYPIKRIKPEGGWLVFTTSEEPLNG
jgi:hypothetical protein